MRKSESIRSKERLEHMMTVARAAGVKLTHQRLEICRELAGTVEHPDAETIFRAVQRRMPTVSLDTVYRTLWMLHDLGLLTKLGPQSDGVRFDANLDRHHHYVCVRCGLVRDFESKDLDRLRVPDALKEFGTIVDAHVEVRGLCAKCQPVDKAAKPSKTKQSTTKPPTTQQPTATQPRAQRPRAQQPKATKRRTR